MIVNRDFHGALGQIQPGTHPDFPKDSIEGGDAIGWSGAYYYITKKNPIKYFSFISFFEVLPGRYVRHPDPKLTYNGFGSSLASLSRDQMCGAIAGIIASKEPWAMSRLIKQHAKRLFLFSWNTMHNGVDPKTAKWKLPDLTGPEILAQELRGIKKGWYDILLPLLDLHMLANTWFFNRVPAEKENECISYLIKLFISVEHKPTLFSRLALRTLDKRLAREKLNSYWCGWREQPYMAALFYSKLVVLRNESLE